MAHYVLDTSVLLDDPHAWRMYPDAEVHIPFTVLKELEEHRKRSGPLAYQARESLRTLDALTAADSIQADSATVFAEGSTTVFVELNNVHPNPLLPVLESNDDRIMTVALNLSDKFTDDVTLVTGDVPMRIKSRSLGLAATPHIKDVAEKYTGVAYAETENWELLKNLHTKGESASVAALCPDVNVPDNCGMVVSSGNSSVVGVSRNGLLTAVNPDRRFYGLTPAGAEQKIAADLLADDDIPIVSLGGSAGSGKTILALAAGLQKTLKDHAYKRILVFRPGTALPGQEIGYLPGDKDDKMAEWRKAVDDALYTLEGMSGPKRDDYNELLSVEPLTFIRGRTLTDTWVIVDEAQQLEPVALVTALTRLGEGSKMILTHDVAQTDNRFVDVNNGIQAVVDRLKGSDAFGHVTFSKSRRSRVSDMVNKRLILHNGAFLP